MIEIETNGETENAFGNPDLLQEMASRWDARQQAVQAKRQLDETLGPLPTNVAFACMDPEHGRYPKQPYVETADGEFTIDPEYARFDPPGTIKKGNSSMAENWNRYAGAGCERAKWGYTLDDKERKIWKKYAGNPSITPSTSLPGNNKLSKQKGPSDGTWAHWTLLQVVYRQKEMMGKSVAITAQKRYPRADLTKWPLNTNGPTTDSDFLEIWDAETASLIPLLSRSRRRARRRKKASKQTGKKDANAHRSMEVGTELLDDLRNTVAGATAEKLLVR
ncbi:hypothetical protein NCS57_00807600 [Fusarium keratoplasticum]|uniref:Uncharacterized protein n=1 Tax=Fusarium keratoplasticum TaxID=1328300 RepID=A0ACC0QRT8_9HYPO|nr:hypothetical protein NCS57_00807600 [Fusarium keratoplasticum]KAI8665849.1 hypothetical protein NCS57_00807600 [Fusarium keratoplasticum]KAI8670303.1 hypothetical protein NCS55_00776100 [Fusarium keratoplasticum]